VAQRGHRNNQTEFLFNAALLIPFDRKFVLTLRRIVTILVFLCMVPSGLWAKTKQIDLRWDEISYVVAANKVDLTLAGGEKVSRDMPAVRDEGITLTIKKTSDAGLYPKGRMRILRRDVRFIKVTEPDGRGKWRGLSIGIIGGLFTGIPVLAKVGGQESTPALVGFTAATGVAGYFIGRHISRGSVMIRVAQ
jgi:hypothetical protein